MISYKRQVSACCDFTGKTGGTICFNRVLRVRFVAGIGFCCGHWGLRQRISHTRTVCYRHWILYHWVCDTIDETRGAICSGHWLLCLMISLTKQEVGFCYGHWVLYFDCDVTQEIRVRLVTGIGFCVLRYQIRAKRCGFLRAFGSASSDVIYETRGTICSGQ